MKDGSEKSRVSDQMNWGGFAEWETPGGGGDQVWEREKNMLGMH